MAVRIIERLVDDVDGSEAAESVRFGLDTVQYEIDLNDQNAALLRSVLAPYVAKGRKVAGGRIVHAQASGRSRVPTADQRAENQQIREWAARNGWSIAQRGRIPANVVDAYRAAQEA